ncbi:MAG TPA: hypothetical protein VMM14_07075 [Acidimicrobiia bacterium]|nr:hypothetical protein [Acidimicrobiia bacterium]
MRRKLIVLSAIFGLLAASGVASAAEEDTGQEPDTTFNFGYDEHNGVFVWGASDSNGPTDCTLGNGPLDATYTRVTDSYLLVVDLQDGGETVELEPNPEHEDFEELAPVPYPGDDEECAVSGDFVAGPQGQINHGMFMKLFTSMFTGPGRGCLVRHIAQSGLGNPPEVDTETEAGDPDEGTIEFETVMTKCNHGPSVLGPESEEDGNGPPAHASRPDNAGPPGHARGNSENPRGKSGDAPGRNK